MDANNDTPSDDVIDLSRAPLGVKAASALVQAIAASDDRVERHYLEVKSNVDLTQKKDIAKLAKFILGSANRQPDVASTAFEGYGVMVIGVAPGKAEGVPPVEVLDLDKIISKYIGASGPRWDVIRVPVSGSDKEVLVLIVDPPRDGQDPFPCRQEGENLHNGRIYIRAEGATREAKADELDILIRRGKHQTRDDVKFDVEIVGTAYPIVIDNARTIDAYIDQEIGRLLNALPRPEPKSSDIALSNSIPGPSAAALRQLMKASQASRTAALAAGFTSEPEKRSEEQYRSSIDEWEERLRSRWQGALDELSSYLLDGVSVRVSNPTKVFFHNLEVKVHLEGDVRGIGWRDGSDGTTSFSMDIPTPPREWGPTTRTPFSHSLMMNPSQYVGVPDFHSGYQSPLDWDNSGSVNLTLDVGELRPRQTFGSDDDELILVLPRTGEDEIRGTWEITARDHNDIYTGELSVTVGESLDLTDSVREFLGLD